MAVTAGLSYVPVMWYYEAESSDFHLSAVSQLTVETAQQLHIVIQTL